MSSNRTTQKNDEVHHVNEQYPEGLGLGSNLSHVKTSGGMTISPELFEKVTELLLGVKHATMEQ